jgi:DNA-binding winged helix-turn-helix (wHTH) protein/TolB-like protein
MATRVRFGSFETDLASGELWRDGAAVVVQDLPFRLLAALLEHPGEVVTRPELTARLWGPDTFVDSTAGLNTAVAKLREALDDRAEQPVYIETVPKRGYRFIGTIEAAPAATPAIPGALTSTFPAPATIGPASPAALTPAIPAPAATATASAPASGSGWRGHWHWRWVAIAMAATVVVSLIAVAAYRLLADRAPVRVAVVLFDNETGDPARARLAQALTDAMVTELTADGRLAVIGNAAVLRTTRPFRDIQTIRDALRADYIVIGQLQTRDAETIVRAHLIRAQDQAHVKVDVATLTAAGETALQSDIAGRVRTSLDRAITSGDRR